MRLDKNQLAFLALVQAGLWEKEVPYKLPEEVSIKELYKLAQEQSVTGLVAAGLEHAVNLKVPRAEALVFGSYALQLEHRNMAMNEFVARQIERLRAEGIYALLVKGQGIAQCYHRPLWRVLGDVDLLLNAVDYEKAKKLLVPMATDVDSEFSSLKHLGMKLDGWALELHGTLHTRLSRRIDNEIDKVQDGVFQNGEVRVWHNGETDVFLPDPDADVIFVFTHFLHHFFLEGLGLRQICDWCRLLWRFAGQIDVPLLARRLRTMGLMSEWRAFAALAVDWLGMPSDAMPLYSDDARWHRKGERILADVLEKGSFGRNQQRDSEPERAYLVRKFVSTWRHLRELLRHFLIFPKDSVVFFGEVVRTGLDAAFRGE